VADVLRGHRVEVAHRPGREQLRDRDPVQPLTVLGQRLQQRRCLARGERDHDVVAVPDQAHDLLGLDPEGVVLPTARHGVPASVLAASSAVTGSFAG